MLWLAESYQTLYLFTSVSSSRVYMQMLCGVQSCVLGHSVSFASANLSCETLRNLCRSWLWRLAARPLTPEGGLEPGMVCCKICGGLSGTETGFSPTTSVSSCDCHYTNVTHTYSSREKNSRWSLGTFKQSHSRLMLDSVGQKALTLFS